MSTSSLQKARDLDPYPDSRPLPANGSTFIEAGMEFIDPAEPRVIYTANGFGWFEGTNGEVFRERPGHQLEPHEPGIEDYEELLSVCFLMGYPQTHLDEILIDAGVEFDEGLPKRFTWHQYDEAKKQMEETILGYDDFNDLCVYLQGLCSLDFDWVIKEINKRGGKVTTSENAEGETVVEECVFNKKIDAELRVVGRKIVAGELTPTGRKRKSKKSKEETTEPKQDETEEPAEEDSEEVKEVQEPAPDDEAPESADDLPAKYLALCDEAASMGIDASACHGILSDVCQQLNVAVLLTPQTFPLFEQALRQQIKDTCETTVASGSSDLPDFDDIDLDSSEPAESDIMPNTEEIAKAAEPGKVKTISHNGKIIDEETGEILGDDPEYELEMVEQADECLEEDEKEFAIDNDEALEWYIKKVRDLERELEAKKKEKDDLSDQLNQIESRINKRVSALEFKYSLQARDFVLSKLPRYKQGEKEGQLKVQSLVTLHGNAKLQDDGGPFCSNEAAFKEWCKKLSPAERAAYPITVSESISPRMAEFAAQVAAGVKIPYWVNMPVIPLGKIKITKAPAKKMNKKASQNDTGSIEEASEETS